jgi:hypothetical protein
MSLDHPAEILRLPQSAETRRKQRQRYAAALRFI